MKAEEIKVRISVPQMKMARLLKGWSQSDLADRAEISTHTVLRIEAKGGIVKTSRIVLKTLMDVFDKNGIEFLGDNEKYTGVGLRIGENL